MSYYTHIYLAILPPEEQTQLVDIIVERTELEDFSLPEVIRSIKVIEFQHAAFAAQVITVGIPDNTRVGKECTWKSTAIQPEKSFNVSPFIITIRFPNQELKKKCETKLKKFRSDALKRIKALSPKLVANRDHWHKEFIDFLYTLPEVIEYLENNPYTPVEWWSLLNMNLAKAVGTTCETTGNELLPCLNPLCDSDCDGSVVYKWPSKKNEKTYLMSEDCCKRMMNIRKDELGNDVFDFPPFGIHGESCNGEDGTMLFSTVAALTKSPNALARLYPFLRGTPLGDALMEMDSDLREKDQLKSAAHYSSHYEHKNSSRYEHKKIKQRLHHQRKAAERFEAELERHKKEAEEAGDDSMSEENQARYWNHLKVAYQSFYDRHGYYPWVQVLDAIWEDDWFKNEEQRAWLVVKSRKGSIVRKENGNNFVPSELGKVEDVGKGGVLLGVEVPKSCIVLLNTGFDSRNLETYLILKCKKEWPGRTCNQRERAGNMDIQAKKIAAKKGIEYVQKKRVCAVVFVDLDRGIIDGSIKLCPDRKLHSKDFIRLKKAWPDGMLDHDKISNY